MAAQNQPLACPYTIRVGEPQTLVGADGAKPETPIHFAPCLGQRCMAFATITGDDGKRHASCQRLVVATLLDSINTSLETIAADTVANDTVASNVVPHPTKQ